MGKPEALEITAPGEIQGAVLVSQHIVGVGHYLLREPNVPACDGRTGMVHHLTEANKSVFSSVSGHRIDPFGEGLPEAMRGKPLD